MNGEPEWLHPSVKDTDKAYTCYERDISAERPDFIVGDKFTYNIDCNKATYTVTSISVDGEFIYYLVNGVEMVVSASRCKHVEKEKYVYHNNVICKVVGVSDGLAY